MAGDRDREIKLTVLGDNRQAVAAIDGIETRLGGFKSALGSVSAVAGGFLAANVIAGGFQAFRGFIGGAIEDASQLEQSLGAVDQVFGTMADSIHRNAKNAADDLGLSRNAYNELATMSGTIFKGMGLDIGTATEMTDELIGRGADLAAMFGGTPREAVERLNSAIIGNTEAVRSYGITLTAVDIQERALLMTGKERAADLTQAEKQQAAYALILERSADAAGQFARESDTAAGSAAREAAARENLSQQIGTYMLPLQVRWNEAKLALVQIIAERVLPALERFAGWVGNNVVPVVQQLADWVGPKLSAFVGEMTPKVQEAFGRLVGFFNADVRPAFDNIVAGARAIIDFLADNWPRIETIVMPVLRQVLNGIETTMGVAARIIATVMNIIAGDWDEAWSNLKEAGRIAWDGIVGTFENARDLLKGIIDAVIDAITTVTSKLDGLLGLTDRVGGAVSGVGDFLGGAASGVGGLLGFDSGGVVPGRRGEPRLVLAHAGETILPTHRGGGGFGGRPLVFAPVIQGSLYTSQELRREFIQWVSEAGRNGEFRGVLT